MSQSQRGEAAVDQLQAENERLRAELEQLRKSSRRAGGDTEGFAALFTKNPIPMWVYELDSLKVLEVNKAAVQQYGYPRTEFLNLKITDIRPEQDVPLLIEDVATDRPDLQHSGEWRHRRKNGEIFEVQITSHRMTYDGRDAVLVAAQDISQRKAAERKLRAALNEIEDLYQNAPCGYHSIDRDGRIIHMNETELAWLGYSREEVIEKMHIWDLLTPRSREAFQRSFPEFVQSGRIKDAEFEFLRKDGSSFPVLMNATAIRDDSGAYKMSRSSVFDLTELKRTRDALKDTLTREREARRDAEQARERLAFLNESSQILTSNQDHNETFRQLAELAVPRIADAFAFEIFDQSDSAFPIAVTHRNSHQAEQMRDFLENHPTTIDEEHDDYESPDLHEALLISDTSAIGSPLEGRGERHQKLIDALDLRSYIYAPIRTNNAPTGAILLAMTSADRTFDIDDLALSEELAHSVSLALAQSKLHQKLVNLNAELEERVNRRTNRLQEVNRELEAFSYSVSHDLRAPLRAIDGFSQALLEDYGPALDEQGRHYLERNRAASQRMGELIEDLLELSRVTRGDLTMQDVNLDQMAREILSQLELADPERDASFRIEEGLTVRADRRLMELALRNLLENAWKFTSNQDRTEIRFGSCGPKTGRSGHCCFVSDNGVGFNMKYAEKLFTPFQRLHSSDEFPGTGIGLATVKRVVHRHNGRVWADSRQGEGATFYLTLWEDTPHGEA